MSRTLPPWITEAAGWSRFLGGIRTIQEAVMTERDMGGPAYHGATRSEARQRFRGMRYVSLRRGKYVPTFSELESAVPHDMRCPSCRKSMNWFARNGQKTVMTLQHNRDGSIQMLCKSCNTRHAYCEGDSFYDIPDGYKNCPGCRANKPLSEFDADNHRRWRGKKTYCQDCSKTRIQEWRERNREKANQYQREYRARRKRMEESK